MRAEVPICLSFWPPLPIRMAFWLSRSQKMAAAMRSSLGLSSKRSTMTAVA